ncbi:MAG: FitA-like ribbon-helix-helix domain-containing protein [Acidimicrobiales bacterium]
MADLNVRNVPDDVLARLRDQASQEGVSLSEWVRMALADRAATPTAAELVARRQRLGHNAQPREEFDRYYRARLRHRTA